MLDPRFNLRYTLIDGRDKGSINSPFVADTGFFSKAPSLLYLYPDKAYWDKTGLSYYDPVAQNGCFVVTTKIFENPRNTNLEPAVNTKLEAGIDFGLGGTDISLTVYSEKMENGFSISVILRKLHFQQVYSAISERP